ncbi:MULTISPECIES: type II secretion system secretin GspD [Marinobacter]|jgi:general secretion pathway protein D|uniref:Type II secretion system protein D n=1 Tax=Marinobacter salarius TaxID=1420917 RepID=A0A1W6K810_9GAMM|nr:MULTISPECIES: type II secretion system secretin GspD [Marinobacter]ARM83575.1 type II secretion system protein D [Marinobacter salarius]MBJ7299856.1 type II secretion system secretin GspD [Marinobacter salarius]MBS8230234.1 type II secretion system protein GspD [Marinobacter salarius]MCC4282770.1 type II secretion system secretin GspD [Marinobacter salarius]MDC8456098.1 type II secretion system secretin GspD [Marinobacter sp. DS40M6]|tara:strand:- start:3590 stop:5542 length:1953 start_codon:yes stop_codon:yes gene_type:complete
MLNHRSKLFRAFVLALLMPLMSVAYGQETETWRLNLKDADIRAFVTQVADITGYSFVVDPRVKGKVTVLSSAPMNKDEIYDLFLAVLQVHGFTAIPGEEVIKVVQQVDAKQSAESLERFTEVPSEQLITRVIQIDNANALELVPILRPLVAKYGHLAGVAAANALIVSDHSSNIQRIEQIVRELDSPSKYEVEVIQLEEAWVGDMVELLQELAPAELGQGGGDNAARKYSVTADERSNRLILRGDETFRDKMRELIRKLDQPSATGGTTKVIRLSHADAENLTEILKGVMGEVAKESTGGSGGAGGSTGSGRNTSFSVFADEGLNALVVRGEPSMMQEAEMIVKALDVRRAQVMIEAAIVEISDELGQDLGVQLALGDESGESTPVAGTNFNNVGRSLGDVLGAILSDSVIAPATGGITIGAGQRNENGVSWGVLLQALSTSAAANLLSTPSIITLDNQESEIIVGQNVPFRTGQSTVTGDGTTNPFTTIERRDIGLTLKVTPTISADGLVRLVVEQTTENIGDSVESASDIITNKREIKTTVLADDGETIVLGGLTTDDLQVNKSKVPLLGDIPVLGRLFSSESERRVKRNLLVFLRPTIMLGKADAVAATDEKFQSLWEINLGVRKKLGLPDPERPPTKDSLFRPQPD